MYLGLSSLIDKERTARLPLPSKYLYYAWTNAMLSKFNIETKATLTNVSYLSDVQSPNEFHPIQGNSGKGTQL